VTCPVHEDGALGLASDVGSTADPYGELAPREVAPPVDPEDAAAFVRTYYAEVVRADPAERLRQVRAELDATGDYTHTRAEIQWACRVAWRNADRCVGRVYWNGLQVRDLRHVADPRSVAEAAIEQARVSFNGGRIRPTMTVLGAAAPGTAGPRILNEQLIRYAGDPKYAPLRELAQDLGWSWDGDRWAVLPLVARTDWGPPALVPVPRDAVAEVRLEHPHHPWFADLDLRWHALPIITDMRLEAGGKWYFAPFGGWYVETEISARNLADADRLNMLPVIATLLGLDRSESWTDWRSAATVVLNQAVLWSFARDRVRISDHHAEAARFLEHLARESRAGRAAQENVDWSWVNLPSATPTPTYHRYYRHQPDQPLPRLVRYRPPTALQDTAPRQDRAPRRVPSPRRRT
jgi:nitric-oxide synthase